MLKRLRIRNWHVPNRVAVIAAVLLLVSSLAGTGSSPTAPGIADTAAPESLIAARETPREEEVADRVRQSTVHKARRFRSRLFLFRH